jgi:hypothetical protein
MRSAPKEGLEVKALAPASSLSIEVAEGKTPLK